MYLYSRLVVLYHWFTRCEQQSQGWQRAIGYGVDTNKLDRDDE